jgi:hypothetical protein
LGHGERSGSTRSTGAWLPVPCVLVPCVLASCLLPRPASAGPLNLATLSCATYENEVLASTVPGYTADPIDTVMWLFGFSVARSGERAMYGDSLTAFGFALDAECKNNPDTTLLAAVTSVKSKRQNPMDLTTLPCSLYEARHVALRKSEPEGANTLTMWLYGYAVGLTKSHELDAAGLAKFDAQLDERCTQKPEDTLFDALNPSKPPTQKRAKPKAEGLNTR